MNESTKAPPPPSDIIAIYSHSVYDIRTRTHTRTTPAILINNDNVIIKRIIIAIILIIGFGFCMYSLEH